MSDEPNETDGVDIGPSVEDRQRMREQILALPESERRRGGPLYAFLAVLAQADLLEERFEQALSGELLKRIEEVHAKILEAEANPLPIRNECGHCHIETPVDSTEHLMVCEKNPLVARLRALEAACATVVNEITAGDLGNPAIALQAVYAALALGSPA